MNDDFDFESNLPNNGPINNGPVNNTSMNNNGTKVASTSTAINTTPTISITSSSAIDIIKKAKGICSIPTEQNAYNYIVFSGSMTVKFHYTDYV